MNERRRCALISPIAVVASLLLGCQATPGAGRASSATPLPAGSTHLIHLPGIAGDTPFDRWWLDALREGGAADQTELYDWTCNDRWIGALQAIGRNHGEAIKVADRIAGKLRADPSGKVVLTAESGGTGIAVWALERLPPGMMVDEVLLIAPALSPDYDLSAALRHVRGRAFYFDSPADTLMLGFGTRLYGTIDGKRTVAAGLVGFRAPARSDAYQYRKLVEMKYEPGWLWLGNFGNHTGAMSFAFARQYLAPMLLRDRQRMSAPDSTAATARRVASPTPSTSVAGGR